MTETLIIKDETEHINQRISFPVEELRPTIEKVARQLGGAKFKRFKQLEQNMIDAVESAQSLAKPAVVFSLHKVRSVSEQGGVILENDVILELPEMERDEDIKFLAACVSSIGPDLEMECRRLNQENEFIDAMVLDAVGSCFLEALAEKSYQHLKSLAQDFQLFAGCRFGPGYQEMPLKTQSILFNLVDGSQAGIELTKHMIMKPLKSLSFFTKFSPNDSPANRLSKCGRCSMKSCIFRAVKP